MTGWWIVCLVFGVNFMFWGAVGVMRLVDEWGARRRPRPDSGRQAVDVASVAVLMAAHNEEVVIAESLAAVCTHVSAHQVHVVSDNSSDDTVHIAQDLGVHVIETPGPTGKAGALVHGLEEFRLCERYAAVLILDADTRLAPGYFSAALPAFDDPAVVAVAGCARTRWEGRLGALGSVVVAHRERVYVLTQALLKFGQCWRGISTTHIVPGFASLYRSTALATLDINPPGLVIEDFNMTFQLNSRRLGTVAFSPRARAYTQDPASLGDYARQTRRWALGLWQTLRHTSPGRPAFEATLCALLVEALLAAAVLLTLPVVGSVLVLAWLWPGTTQVPGLGALVGAISTQVTGPALFWWLVVPDYLLTCVVAAVERRPRFLLVGLVFIPMRILDAWLMLVTLPQAWRTTSSGRWVSPSRRAIAAPNPETVKDLPCPTHP